MDYKHSYRIVNADVSLSNSSLYAIRSDVVVILGFRLGDGSTIVFQQHADVVSGVVCSLSVAQYRS